MMRMRALVAISVLALRLGIAAAQCTLPFTCVPEDDCAGCATAGDQVPDPADCERYYVCITSSGGLIPSGSSLACPTDNYFNASSGACAAETTPGVCDAGDGCDSILPTTTISPTVTCNTTCPTTNFVAIADVHNCSLYYICIDSNPAIPSSCPSDNPYFDGESCGSDQSLCCDFCTPYCSAAFIEIEDPCDCSAYYICTAVGTADEANRFTCSSGQYFDANIPGCVDGTCTNVCSTCQSSSAAAATTAAGLTTTTATTVSGGGSSPATTSVSGGATSSASLSSTTENINGCTSLSSFTCPQDDGNFARCTECDQSYFHCDGSIATIRYCPDNQVFNTDEEYPFCLLPENCPYP